VRQKKRDDTKAGAASAKVVPLWPASIRDLPTGYLEQVARRVRANLADLVAMADTYNLDLATDVRVHVHMSFGGRLHMSLQQGGLQPLS
jgi:hypothetical protein